MSDAFAEGSAEDDGVEVMLRKAESPTVTTLRQQTSTAKLREDSTKGLLGVPVTG